MFICFLFFFISLFCFFITSIAFLNLPLGFFLFGVFLFVILSKILKILDKKEVNIFIFCFLFYFLYLTAANIIFTLDASKIFPYDYVDQKFFYKQARDFSQISWGIDGVLNAYNQNYYSKQFLYALFNGLLNIFSLAVSGEYASLNFLKIPNTFFSALTMVVVYKIFKIFFDEKSAFRYVIIFSILSPYLFISQTILRDSMLSFFFVTCSLYYFRDYSIKNFLIMVVMIFFVYFLRFENVIFLIALAYFYIFELSRKFFNMQSSFILSGIFLVIPIIIFLFFFQGDFFSSLIYYSELGEGNLLDNSLIKLAYSLPVGLNFFGLLLFGLLSPFPFWHMPENSVHSILYFIFYLPRKIGVLYVLVMFAFMGIFLVKRLHVSCGNLQSRFRFSVVVFFLFVLFSSANFSERRIMCVYPVLFIVSLTAIRYLGSKGTIMVSLITLLLYASLNIIYLLI